MNRPRFQVSVTHGDRFLSVEGAGGAPPNACAYVYDRLCDRIAAEFPTEGRGAGSKSRPRRTVEEVTEMAERRCAELNVGLAAA